MYIPDPNKPQDMCLQIWLPIKMFGKPKSLLIISSQLKIYFKHLILKDLQYILVLIQIFFVKTYPDLGNSALKHS